MENSPHQGNTTLTTLQADAESNAVKPEISRVSSPCLRNISLWLAVPVLFHWLVSALRQTVSVRVQLDLLLLTTSPLFRGSRKQARSRGRLQSDMDAHGSPRPGLHCQPKQTEAEA